MKQLTSLVLSLALVACTFTFTGCISTQQQQWTCDRALATYEAYQAAVDAGVITDPDTIAQAKLAAAFLSGYCGWYPVPPRDAKGRYMAASSVDRNGVLIVSQP